MMPQPRNRFEGGSFPYGPSHAGSGPDVPSDSQPEDQKSHGKANERIRRLGSSLAWMFRTNLPPQRGLPLEHVHNREWFGFGERLNVIVNPSYTLHQLTETRRALQKTQRDLRLRTSPSSCYIPPRAFCIPLCRSDSTQPLLFRSSEASIIHRTFSGPPAFTVLHGAPSVGKTTLLREVLKDDQKYITTYLDLKMLGTDGVEGLLVSLAAALEGFLEELQMTGIGGVGGEDDIDQLEKLLRAAKHERRILFHRLLDNSQQAEEITNPTCITSNDVTRLLQLFRSSLSLYWSSSPSQVHHTRTSSTSSSAHRRNASINQSIRHSNYNTRGDTERVDRIDRANLKKEKPGWKSRSQIFQFGSSHMLQVSHGGANNDSEEDTKVDNGTRSGSGVNSGALFNESEATAQTGIGQVNTPENQPEQGDEKRVDSGRGGVAHPREEKVRVEPAGETNGRGAKGDNDGEQSNSGRMPVIVFDDAQRLLSLVRPGTMRSKQKAQLLRTLLDGLLVLSKQDGLCHIVHASNDGLYINWLREIHVDGYKVVTLTDPSKSQTQTHFKQSLLTSIPASSRNQLKIESENEKEDMFARLYDAFGGRLSHWSDFMGDWMNAGCDLPVERSTPYLHAYTSLNFLLLRACECEDEAELGDEHETLKERSTREQRDGVRSRARIRRRSCSRSPSQSRAAFGRQARLPGRRPGGMKSSTTLIGAGINGDSGFDANDGNGEKPPFTAIQLLDLMYQLTTPLPCPRPTRNRSRYFSRTSTLFAQSPKMRFVRPFSTRSGKGLSAFVPAKDEDEEYREGSGRGMMCAPIPYFSLCREIGSSGREAVDFLVRSKILDVRWGSCLGDREGGNDVMKEMDPRMYGPTLYLSSPILAHAMRVILEEYGYQPGVVSVFDPGHDHDQEAELEHEHEHEHERPIHGSRRRDDNIRQGDEEDENERDEFVDGEEYDEPPTAVGSTAGKYYGGGGRGGHGYVYASGRDSSGLSDDKSDYVSFVEDVSEY